jgi:hypothetical protein
MRLNLRNTFSIMGLCLLTQSMAHANDANPAEAKLRENLRNTMLQLRTLQVERDALQAGKTVFEQEKQTLTQQLETLRKQQASDREASDKKQAALEAKLGDHETEITRLRAGLQTSTEAHKKAADLAAAKEGERAKLALQNIELQRQVADQRARNLKMYNIGNEILKRYENFGLGTALTAREPFVGTTRVKLENLVQDYQDKLAEQRIKSEPAPAGPKR